MCSGAKWKREEVPDHKFDFIDAREFTDHGCWMRMKYLFVYLLLLKSFLVYVSDIFTAITMISSNSWSNQIFQNCSVKTEDGELEKDGDSCVFIPFSVGKWLFVACIIFSFLLLAYESRKAKKIIASRDISFAFTNVIASRYYSIRSYDHFCFFDHISNSTKTSDDFAFFVFFTFKGWKRLLLADAPRQTINALTLYAIYISRRKDPGEWYELPKYFRGNNLPTTVLTLTTMFTVLIFLGSLVLLIAAALVYFPLLCQIRGNLKEYCCHKVDKRIGTVIKRRQQRRLEANAKIMLKEAAGDFSHLKDKNGKVVGQRLAQPTLPQLSVDDDDLHNDRASVKTRSTHATGAADPYYFNSADYPPIPHNPYSHQTSAYTDFHASMPEQQQYNSTHNLDYDEVGSTTHLASTAAPFASDPHGGAYNYNTRDIYTGGAPVYDYDSPQPALGRGYDEERNNGRAM